MTFFSRNKSCNRYLDSDNHKKHRIPFYYTGFRTLGRRLEFDLEASTKQVSEAMYVWNKVADRFHLKNINHWSRPS